MRTFDTGDCLIEVTTWAGFIVCICTTNVYIYFFEYVRLPDLI